MKLIIILVGLLAIGQAGAATFNVDPDHTTVGFGADYMVLTKVNGKFNTFKGSFDFDEKAKTLKDVAITVDIKSINTGNKDRDDHLLSGDFFEAAKFPEMTFKGTSAKFAGEKPVSIDGTLTIRGVSKPVTLQLENKGTIVDPKGNTRLGFKASGKINRMDFGVKWNKPLDKAKGVMVGEMVDLVIEGQGILKK